MASAARIARGPARLHARAQQLGVSERITWTGLLQGDLKWGALLAAEAFVLPSHQENFGIAVAEALAVGTPVLISYKVNIWLEIEAEHAGLVAADTLDGTAGLLQRWLALTPGTQANFLAMQALPPRTRSSVDCA